MAIYHTSQFQQLTLIIADRLILEIKIGEFGKYDGEKADNPH
jgi:hypothetical protein